jgi:hypothetical protein
VTSGGHVLFEMGVNILLTSRTSGFARRERKSWVLQLTKLRSAKWRGEKSEPLDPRTGGPLDQNSVAISYIGSSRVRRLEGVTFNRRSHEVPRAEARVRTRGTSIKWGLWLTGGYASPREGSQRSD